MNSHGMNCTQTCSVNCGLGQQGAAVGGAQSRLCSHVSGDCFHGCKSGFEGVTCSQSELKWSLSLGVNKRLNSRTKQMSIYYCFLVTVENI